MSAFEADSQSAGLAEEATRLCLSCGLCCQGVLFSHVNLDVHETELTDRFDLPEYPDPDGQPAFRLPCKCYQEDRCSIYALRPRICRNYQCKLLQKLLRADISFEQSQEIIQTARRLVAQLREKLPASIDSAAWLWEHTKPVLLDEEKSQAEALQWRRANAALWMEIAVLSAFLQRHFESSNQPTEATAS
jgi:Fe-S-cluster containining protein